MSKLKTPSSPKKEIPKKKGVVVAETTKAVLAEMEARQRSDRAN